MENDEEPTGDFPAGVFGCLFAPLLAPIWLLFKYYGQPAPGVLIIALLAAFATVVLQRRDIANRDYFIAVVPPIFLLEFLVALNAPLPVWKFSSVLLTPLIIGALLINHVIISLAEKYLSRKKR